MKPRVFLDVDPRTLRLPAPGGRLRGIAHMGQTIRLAAIVACAITLTLGCARSQRNAGSPSNGVEPLQQLKLGVSINKPQAFAGYTLLAPMQSTKTYLIDMQGKVVRTWHSNYLPALGASLLDNGHLLRPGKLPGVPGDSGPGAGGLVQEYTWEGELVWDFQFSRRTQLPHHDIARLPNGNVLMIVWERKTSKEALAAGRRPDLVGPLLLVDCLIEVKPTGKTTGEVVWEWHLWDHLVQDHDPSKANYGNVADHPELVDLSFWTDPLSGFMRTKDGMDKLRSIGYVGKTPPGGPSGANLLWSHCNAVGYNPDLDQIVLSVHGFCEFWIIDHSTTTAEAAGHSGGRSGREAISFTAGGIPKRTAPARRRISSSSPCTMLIGLHAAFPAKDICWSSTTAPTGRTAIIRRWMRSFFRLTARAGMRARREPPMDRTTPFGATVHPKVGFLLDAALGCPASPEWEHAHLFGQ